MANFKLPRWFGLLFLVMLALRIGYKYYSLHRPSAAQTQMAQALERQQALIKAIKADQEAQRASGRPVVVADSALLAADTSSARR